MQRLPVASLFVAMACAMVGCGPKPVDKDTSPDEVDLEAVGVDPPGEERDDDGAESTTLE